MYHVHDLDCPGPPLGGTHAGMNLQHLGDLFAHLGHRVEGGHRLLKDHCHAGAAQIPQPGFTGLQSVFAFQQGFPRGWFQRGGQQPHHSRGGHGFTGPAFPDNAYDFTGGDGQIDIFDRVGPIPVGRQGNSQVSDL